MYTLVVYYKICIGYINYLCNQNAQQEITKASQDADERNKNFTSEHISIVNDSISIQRDINIELTLQLRTIIDKFDNYKSYELKMILLEIMQKVTFGIIRYNKITDYFLDILETRKGGG